MTRMNETAAIIIPVYNEAAVVADVVRRARRSYRYVVCVDDGSTDNSRELLHATDAYVIEHPINMGQGAALQTGIEFARLLPVDYFVTFDADGQHRLADVRTMLAAIRRERTDFVFGSRFLGVSSDTMPRAKRALLGVAVVFSRLVSGVRLSDTHNGLRVFNRKVAESIQLTQSDMSHASELLDIVRREKFSYCEVPVQIRYTDYSLRKGQPLSNAVNIAFATITRRLLG